jgi:hypothetical protein
LSECRGGRGKRGNYQHSQDPGQHWLYLRVYNHVNFFCKNFKAIDKRIDRVLGRKGAHWGSPTN